MRVSLFRFARNFVLGVFAILLIGALTGAGWYYHTSQVAESQPHPSKPSPSGRAAAVMALDASRETVPTPSPLPEERTNHQQAVLIVVRPMEQFRADVIKALTKELSGTYGQVSNLTRIDESEPDSAYRDSAFQFLTAAENAPARQQPAMLLAADFLLNPVWCPSEYKERCDVVRKQFEEHKLSLPYSELGGGSYYSHDLLWRIWQDYPRTESGEQAFVLLLDSGWDPSGTCSKGSDQFREVIRHGESFLQQHPNSSNRLFVTHLVGQAYATWWSLSNEPASGMEDYVDPKLYTEGAEQARLKAVEYFEQVLQQSPTTPLGEYSREVLPALRQKQPTSDNYRFFCVYD